MDAGLRFDSGASTKPKSKMSKILRSWIKLPISERIAFMRQAVDKQKATPSPIPHPYPDLTALDTAVSAAETVDAQISALETQLSQLRVQRQTLTDAAAAEFEHDATHVESDSKGDAALEIAAGFKVAGAPQPVGPMTAPQDLAVTPGDMDGELDWQCHPVAGASGIEPQTTLTPTDAASWKSHQVVTQSSGAITGLESGKRTYVRLRAIGPLGPGPWSDIAAKMVP